MMLSQAIAHLIEVARSRDETMAGLGQVSEDARAIRVLLDAILLKPGPGQVAELLRAELGGEGVGDDAEHYPPVKTYKDRLDVLERQMKILLRASVAFPPPTSDEATHYEIGETTSGRMNLTLVGGTTIRLTHVQTVKLLERIREISQRLPFFPPPAPTPDTKSA